MSSISSGPGGGSTTPPKTFDQAPVPMHEGESTTRRRFLCKRDNQTRQNINSSRLYPDSQLETKNGQGVAVGPRPEAGTLGESHLCCPIPVGRCYLLPNYAFVLSEYTAGH